MLQNDGGSVVKRGLPFFKVGMAELEDAISRGRKPSYTAKRKKGFHAGSSPASHT